MDEILERFWDKVKVDEVTGCWNWQASKNYGGYGYIRIDYKLVSSHRFAYEVNKGKIPEGMTLDHLCRNRSCCNPDHLEVVTHKENTLRGIGLTAQNARKTHCPKGHELIGDNLYINPGSKSRSCRKCHIEYMIIYNSKTRIGRIR